MTLDRNQRTRRFVEEARRATVAGGVVGGELMDDGVAGIERDACERVSGREKKQRSLERAEARRAFVVDGD